MAKVILIDADNTLYRILNKEASYDKMLHYLSSVSAIEYEQLKERYFSLLEEVRFFRDIEKRRREYLLALLGFEKDVIRNALHVFIEEVKRNLRVMDGVKEFLETFYRKYDFVIFSDEFEWMLKEKLNATIGMKYFKGMITPEITKCMKPCKEYYVKISHYGYELKDVVLVIGDDYERDIKYAKELGLRTALLTSDSSCGADFCFRDFYELIEVFQDEKYFRSRVFL